MLSKLKRFFEENIALGPNDEGDHKHRLQLATAALLIEVMHSDDEPHDEEKRTILNALKNRFDLTDDEAGALLQLAEQEVKEAVDYYQFTRLINDHFEYPDKVRMIELLWEVAFADQQIDTYEDHTIRKVADLLYVRHSDFVAAKHKVSPH